MQDPPDAPGTSAPPGGDGPSGGGDTDAEQQQQQPVGPAPGAPAYVCAREGSFSSARALEYAQMAPSAGFRSYHELPNISCLETSVPPKGGVAVIEAGAALSPEYITHQLFLGTSLFLVQGDSVPTDRKLSKGCAQLVDSFADRGPSLQKANDEFSGDRAESAWDGGLDTQGSFVGLYRATIFPPGYPAKDIYYVAVTAGPGAAGHELYARAETLMQDPEASATFADFLELPEFSYVRNAASRNRARVAQVFAEAVGVDIDAVGDFAAAQGVAAQGASEPEPDAGETAPRVAPEEWRLLAGMLAAGDFDGLLRNMASRGFCFETPGLIEALELDPAGTQPDLSGPFVAEGAGLPAGGSYPLIGVTCSETIHNNMVEQDGLVYIYSNCASPSSIQSSHGICRLHSPVEGIEMYMGHGRIDIAAGIFGGRVRCGPGDVLPTTSGRVRRSTTVDFGLSGGGAIPHFLHYAMPETRPNDRALFGTQAVYRSDDSVFADHLRAFAGRVYRDERINTTRLKPMQVVILPTPLHLLAREVTGH